MHSRKFQTNGAILVIIAAMLWGTTGTTQALAPPGASSLAIGAVRLALGGMVLLIFSFLKGSFKGIQRWPIPTTLAAAASMALYQPFFFAGVSKTGVAVGTIVAIGSSPVFAGILAYFIRGEKPGSRWLLATVLAIVGNIFLIFSENTLSMNIMGIIFALCAGLAYALYTLASKKLLETYSSDMVVAVVFTLGAVLLFPLLITNDLSWLVSFQGVVVALHLGILTIAVAYSLFVRGLKKVSVADAVTLTLAEPLTAAILGIFFLGEKVKPLAVIGILLLFTGIVVLSINFNRENN
ncbi:MAG: DMT family transporter [Peptococcales bacterium]|jgi:DME family drug/metabolite transporter